MTELIHRADHHGIRTLTLDSPRNRNALTAQLMTELRTELTEAGALNGDGDGDGDGSAIRAVVLTHTGNTFCSGAALGEDSGTPHDLVGLLRSIVELPMPVLAQVTGHVRGGGLGLLGACDISVASTAASFAFAEVRIGVAPAVISMPLLPRLDPRAATRYYLTGERFDAAEAARIGLVTDFGEPAEADAELDSLLTALRRCSPQGLAASKKLVTTDVLRAFDRDADNLAALSTRLFGSAEAREGMTAFLERRDPRWAS